MNRAKTGDKVLVHYNGFFEDGKIFDSTIAGDPLKFTLGHGLMIPGFENAVTGMSEGETKTVTISPEDAFGQYNKKAAAVVEKSRLPDGVEPEIGMKLHARTPEGIVKLVTVTEVNDETITLDGNGPLAGKELTFEIHLLKIL